MLKHALMPALAGLALLAGAATPALKVHPDGHYLKTETGAPKVQKARRYADPKRPALGPKDALRVKGNRLVDAAGKEVWLQGVAICSLEWRADGEHVKRDAPHTR